IPAPRSASPTKYTPATTRAHTARMNAATPHATQRSDAYRWACAITAAMNAHSANPTCPRLSHRNARERCRCPWIHMMSAATRKQTPAKTGAQKYTVSIAHLRSIIAIELLRDDISVLLLYSVLLPTPNHNFSPHRNDSTTTLRSPPGRLLAVPGSDY